MKIRRAVLFTSIVGTILYLFSIKKEKIPSNEDIITIKKIDFKVFESNNLYNKNTHIRTKNKKTIFKKCCDIKDINKSKEDKSTIFLEEKVNIINQSFLNKDEIYSDFFSLPLLDVIENQESKLDGSTETMSFNGTLKNIEVKNEDEEKK
ncbi:MAG: hypothetical protein JW924_08280 [Fusobacteriaceae bacterium]|nr:hypothetical protein [Fusobacteriaceae bacterium]